MKARFSLTALIAAGLILQGCGHEGPDTDTRGGSQLAKQSGSSNGGPQPTSPALQGKANQASSGQQQANRAPASQPAPVPNKAQKEPNRAVQAQTLPQHFTNQKAVAGSHKLHHPRPTQRSDDAQSQAVVAADQKVGNTKKFAGLALPAAPATVAENTIPPSASTSTSAAATTPSPSTETTASSSVSTAGSISGSATSASTAPRSPIGSTPTQATASAATSASAGSNPASNRQLDRHRGRVNELDQLTAKNAKMIADVDARATEGIRNAMSKANEADTHALDAGNRANQTQQTAQQAHMRIATIDQYQPVTRAEIRFRPGQAALSKKAKEALDEMANALKNQRGYIIEIQGFSAGGDAAAIQNSRQMTENVVRYLVLNDDIPVYRIYTVGVGNSRIEADGKKLRTGGGRVEITLLRNGLGVGSSAAGNTSASTGEVSGAVTSATPSSNQTEQPATPAANVAPASQPSNTGVTTKKPPSPSKPPQP